MPLCPIHNVDHAEEKKQSVIPIVDNPEHYAVIMKAERQTEAAGPEQVPPVVRAWTTATAPEQWDDYRQYMAWRTENGGTSLGHEEMAQVYGTKMLEFGIMMGLRIHHMFAEKVKPALVDAEEIAIVRETSQRVMETAEEDEAEVPPLIAGLIDMFRSSGAEVHVMSMGDLLDKINGEKGDDEKPV